MGASNRCSTTIYLSLKLGLCLDAGRPGVAARSLLGSLPRVVGAAGAVGWSIGVAPRAGRVEGAAAMRVGRTWVVAAAGATARAHPGLAQGLRTRTKRVDWRLGHCRRLRSW